MTHEFQKRWLRISAIAIGGFAPLMLLGSVGATLAPAQFAIDLVALPLDGAPAFGDPASRLLSGILAGVLLGWATVVWVLQRGAFDLAPEAVRRAVVMSFVVWFVVDGIGSAASGHASNILFNLPLFVIGIGPLWRPARDEGPVTARV